MSRKERGRLTVMAGVKGRELTLVQAADLMGVCYRQGKRIWKRYQVAGDAGLVHGLRGKPSARRKPSELRAQVLALYAQERYADFGPTLMAEHLAKEKLVVDHETLRRWRLPKGNTRCGGASRRTGNGGSASRASGRWCNWTARTTTGLKGGLPGAC